MSENKSNKCSNKYRKISLDRLELLFEAISEKKQLYLPCDREEGRAEYERWAPGKKLSGAVNTGRSAKDFFFRSSEDIVGYKVEGKALEMIDITDECDLSEFVLFGVRACDVVSFDILDRVFLAEPVDSRYKARRQNATIVSLACRSAEETCFCTTFGINPAEPGADVSAWKTGEYMYFRANTEKGDALMSSLASVMEQDAENNAPSIVEAEKKRITEELKTLPLHALTTEKFDGANLLEVFNSPKWQELSQACIGCGTCTFVCPTCQCYDIREFNTGRMVRRFRCWDSCMYSDFTKMAAANPRLTQLERFRQRFMHKLVYFPQNNNGLYGCVGCGRCLAKCPISMNIVKVMKSVGEEKA